MLHKADFILDHPDAKLPSKSTEAAVGYDVCSIQTLVIPSGGFKLVETGLKIALPPGYECQVRPRSGLALKHGVTVLNTPGTIDPDYRGKLGVILANFGVRPYTVTKGDRIAQLVFSSVLNMPVRQVTYFDTDTERSEGGFGSTGK